MTYEFPGLVSRLEEFVAVARYEHVTRAAEALGIPQPTLSRSLARLSAEIGAPLLRRDGRGVRLTRAGEVFAEHAERALAEVRAGVRAVHTQVDPDTGTVVLGFLHSLGRRVVPELVKSFRAERPGLTVRLVQGAPDELLAALVAGRIDVCVVGPIPARLISVRRRKLVAQRMVVLVPSGHRLAERRSVGIEDLAGEPMISLAPGFGTRAIADRLFAGARITPNEVFESQDIDTAAGLVAAGLGVAILPRGDAVPGAVEIALAAPGASRTIYAAWAGDRAPTPAAIALRRHVIEHAPAQMRPSR